MAQKTVDIPGIGEVLLVKRRGTKNLRITIQSNGTVRIGLPAWAPYAAAIKFAVGKADWINRHKADNKPHMLRHGHRIGKSYRLKILTEPTQRRVYSRLSTNTITISSPYPAEHASVQESAAKACERALKKEAQRLFGIRLEQLAKKHGYTYKQLRVKRLSSRWGSCSQDKLITLNYYLIQLPWRFIDYVMVHELAHTEYMNHSREFWESVEKIVPDAKTIRREIKRYRPILLPN